MITGTRMFARAKIKYANLPCTREPRISWYTDTIEVDSSVGAGTNCVSWVLMRLEFRAKGEELFKIEFGILQMYT